MADPAPSPDDPGVPPRLGGAFVAAIACLALIPSILYFPSFRRGEIPLSMDTVMYFFPLRWHAAALVHAGELPLWNRCILGGMPLFANPQAALAYPFHWPMLAWPGAFWFVFPLTFQLGLWGGLTALLLRRIDLPRAAALWGGALCIAGNYGWSRLQFGNFMNVLPWLPVWLIAAHGFAGAEESRARGRWLFVGAAASALLILSGAHQIAAYAAFAFGLYSLWMCASAQEERRRWALFFAAAWAWGLALGALGWLPQIAFLRETARGGGLDANAALAGAYGSPLEILSALTGPWKDGVADAEASASLGVLAFAIAFAVPGNARLRRAWIGAWLMALGGALVSWRPTMDVLLKIAPAAGVFHDPRRALGIAHWALVLAASLSLGSLFEEGETRKRWRWMRVVPSMGMAVALIISLGTLGADEFSRGWAIVLLAITLLLLAAGASWSKEGALFAISSGFVAAVATAYLGAQTAQTTALEGMRVAELFNPEGKPPILAGAGLKPGERFFSLDWQRESSYEYRRPDLGHWAFPNLAMLHGWEDIGGYEPARSSRYEQWLTSASAWPGGRQPWAAHFGLLYPPPPERFPGALGEANVRAALLPIWGLPVYLREMQKGLSAGLAPERAGAADLRAVYLAAVEGARDLSIISPESGEAKATFPFDAASRERGARPVFEQTELGKRFAVDQFSVGAGSLAASAIAFRAAPGDRVLGCYIWNGETEAAMKPFAAEGLAMACKVEPSVPWAQLLGEGSQNAAVRAPEIHANRIRVEIASPGAEALVVHDAFWPGWTARVNGKPAEIAPAPGGFWRSVKLPSPARDSVVTMEYWPPLMTPALLLTLAGLAAPGAYALFAWLKLRGSSHARRLGRASGQ